MINSVQFNMMSENNTIINHNDFLLSNWYSGATILSIILNNHPQITCNGETLPFPDQIPEELICSCTNPITKCEFYNYAAKHFISNNTYDKKYFTRIPLIFDNTILLKIFRSYHHPYIRNIICNLIPGYNDKIEYFIRSHEKFFKMACEYDKSSIYLDGVKSPRRAELFAQYSKKPIRILHSIRDGRKFVASCIKTLNLTEEQIPKYAQNWVDYIKMVEILQKRHPHIELKEVRHEDLCHDKESTIKGICDFLGVDYDPDIFVFGDSTYHVLGNNLRKKFDGVIFENDKWKSVYSEQLFDKVTDIQKSYLSKYNYL